MEHISACHAHAQNPKPAEVTRTAERTASRRRQRRERAHIDSRHRFLSFVPRYCATQVVTSICMPPGHPQQASRRAVDGARQRALRSPTYSGIAFVRRMTFDSRAIRSAPRRPKTSPSPFERRREKTCPLLAQDPLHSIRPTHDVTSSPHGTAWRLRGGSLLESVLADPQVELRARQPKPPRGFRFVSSAFVQDLPDRGAFESAQIRGVVAKCPGA
jgi:hypothetical protein